jgi:hypothetical protein
MALFLLVCICTESLFAQSLAGIAVHGFVTQGFLFSSSNNYLTMESSDGSVRWTDGAVNVTDSFADKLRVGIQLHMYQLGQLGGAHLLIDWASGDYRFNDHFGIRAGKVKTPLGLFNDSQDVDAVFLWILLPQGAYPIDNEGFFLSQWGGEVYGGVPVGGRGGKLLYRAYAGHASLDLHGGYIKELADYGLAFTSAPGGLIYGGDLRWETPLRGLTFGSSALVDTLDGSAPGGSVHVPPSFVNAEYAQFSRGKFYFAGEYRRQPTLSTVTIGPMAFSNPVDERVWYAMGSYRVTEKIQLGSYYSHFLDKAGYMGQPGDYSKDWVVSGRYDFNAHFYGKIEDHFLHGNGIGFYDSTNPNGLTPNSRMLAAKIGFSF